MEIDVEIPAIKDEASLPSIFICPSEGGKATLI